MAVEDLTSQVLSTEAVKVNFREIKQAVLHRGAVVHFGDRQQDDFVIIARARYEALLARAQRAGEAEAGPGRSDFLAGIAAGVRAGTLGGGTQPRHREYHGPIAQDSTITVPEMMALGRGSQAQMPRHRRTRSA
jgi:hypothetical protein